MLNKFLIKKTKHKSIKPLYIFNYKYVITDTKVTLLLLRFDIIRMVFGYKNDFFVPITFQYIITLGVGYTTENGGIIAKFTLSKINEESGFKKSTKELLWNIMMFIECFLLFFSKTSFERFLNRSQKKVLQNEKKTQEKVIVVVPTQWWASFEEAKLF